MKELEKRLKDLQKNGYEQVDITMLLNWMSDIRKDAKIKAIERKANER